MSLIRLALAIVVLFGSVALAHADGLEQTHQTIPSASFSFMSDLQTFLKREDANRYADLFTDVVASGGLHGTAAGLTATPSALIAYPSGYYITEDAAITYPDNSICWVIAHKAVTANIGSFTRVSGTHYLLNCGSSTQPTAPADTVWLMRVTTSGGAITAVLDYRHLSERVRDGCAYGTFNAAAAAFGSTPVVMTVSCRLVVTQDIVSPSTLTIVILPTGVLDLEAASTDLTINGLLVASFTQTNFTGAGFANVTFGPGTVRTITPQRWGAIGDDSHDDTAAIQAAVNAAQSVGESVYFLAGTYKISSTITIKSNVCFIGSNMYATAIHNSNILNAVALHFTDQTTSAKELRFGCIQSMRIRGNSSSGNGIVIDNPYHFTFDRVFIDEHGGIGVDVQKGVYSSTYGQNIFIDRSWIRNNRKGGVRYARAPGSSGVNIVEIRNTSINQNAYYGVFMDGVSGGVITNCEFADYYYGSVVAGNQAVPIALSGGAAINIEKSSFENNGGDGSTVNSHIKVGWNGDTQLDDTSHDTQQLTIRQNDFKANVGQAGGALNHVRLLAVISAVFDQNFFEKEAGYPNIVNGIEWSGTLPTYSLISFTNNHWHTAIDARYTGSYYGNYLQSEPRDGTDQLSYGIHAGNTTDITFWQRGTNDTEDNFQILGDGSIKMGTASAAPFEVLSSGAKSLRLGSTGFTSLGTPSDGTIKYCSDCTFANPCASGGSGAMAKRLNGAWRCD